MPSPDNGTMAGGEHPVEITHPVYAVLLLLAVILLALAAVGVAHPRVGLGWAGLACWATVALLTTIKVG